MAYKYVIYEKNGNIATITLNRPEKLNVLNMMGTNEGVFTDMLNAMTEAEDDDEVKVIVIKGAGKHFCAGEDLSQAGLRLWFRNRQERGAPPQRADKAEVRQEIHAGLVPDSVLPQRSPSGWDRAIAWGQAP